LCSWIPVSVFLASIIDRIDVYLLVCPPFKSLLWLVYCSQLHLFACLACLYPIIDASRVNVVREVWNSKRWRHCEQLLWLKASVFLIFCSNNYD
jgi:hypothetical protein